MFLRFKMNVLNGAPLNVTPFHISFMIDPIPHCPSGASRILSYYEYSLSRYSYENFTSCMFLSFKMNVLNVGPFSSPSFQISFMFDTPSLVAERYIY